MFSSTSSNLGQKQFTLLPEGVIGMARIMVKEIKTAKSGNDYLDVEYVLLNGEHENRRIYGMLGDPWEAASEGDEKAERMKAMTIGQTTRILEACGLVTLGDEESYAGWNEANLQAFAEAIQGRDVPVRVGIQKGKDGYEDKNTIREFGSPSPTSNGFALFQQVQAGLEVFDKKWNTQGGATGAASGAPAAKPAGVPGATAARPAVPAKAAAAKSAAPSWLKKAQ